MSKALNSNQPIANPSPNPHFDAVLAERRRREWLKAGAGLTAYGVSSALIGGCISIAPGGSAKPAAERASVPLGFMPIEASTEDKVRVPPGYRSDVLIAWGDPIGDSQGAPEFRFDASNSAADQALQSGMHHDGMHFFPLPVGSDNSEHGLLAINHEYADAPMMFADGVANWSAEKVKKVQHSLGVAVIEVIRRDGLWQRVMPSRYARRIHANSVHRIAGPAAGHPGMRTVAHPDGLQAIGTFANCANGWTPWGTYLTCEENFHLFFKGLATPTPDQSRYQINAESNLAKWAEHDPRFDVAADPNAINHYGWVVEIDPYDPAWQPVKRTALGRKKQESATPGICADGRLALYMGDDSPFEYLYRFVTTKPFDSANRAANRDLLDEGTLYAARFNPDGTGDWLELTHGKNGLTAERGFASQADVLISARQAADAVGATKMDRPEWVAVDPNSAVVYCSLTGNLERGQAGKPAADAANPRSPNRFGHIISWLPAGADHGSSRFSWRHTLLAGDPNHQNVAVRGNLRGDLFAMPDGLLVDPRGLLWVQTDMAPRELNNADFAIYGNNSMLALEPGSRISRRFLTGPVGAEITGACLTPDACTMFVNIQHPGERGGEPTDPANPRKWSNWPDFRADGRPRSATVVITRDDQAPIGS